MYRNAFFDSVHNEVLKMKWSDLKSVDIRGFPALPSTRKNAEELPVILDNGALSIYPGDAPEMTPSKIYGDENCFFRALSKYVYGSEAYHSEMRVRIVLEMVHNEDLYTSNEHLNLMSEYQVNNLVKELHEHSMPNDIHRFEDYVISMLKPATWAGLWHFFAAANCLKKPIRSVYPNVSSPFVNRSLYNQLIPPIKFPDQNTSKDIPVIMGTNIGNNILSPVWSPNHFVLRTPSSAAIKYQVIGKRKSEDQKSLSFDEKKKKTIHNLQKYKTKLYPSWKKYKYIVAEPNDQEL